MSTLFLQEAGPAPPEVCWERYAVPARWSRWAPRIRSVILTAPADAPAWAGHPAGRPPGPGPRTRPGLRIRPGLRGRIRPYLGPAVHFAVTAVDETDRTWSWRIRLGPVALTLDHGVDACLDGGTSTWLRITGPRPVIYAYAPIARSALRRLVR